MGNAGAANAGELRTPRAMSNIVVAKAAYSFTDSFSSVGCADRQNIRISLVVAELAVLDDAETFGCRDSAMPLGGCFVALVANIP